MQVRGARPANVVLTSYEYLINKKDVDRLRGIAWHYLIADEGARPLAAESSYLPPLMVNSIV